MAAVPRPRTAQALYRHVLRTSRETFAGDSQTLNAFRSFIRPKLTSQLQAQGAGGSSSSGSSSQGVTALSDEVVDQWMDVAKALRMNVVQGTLKEDGETYKLKFTPDTELGSNDTIKQGRQQQLDDLRASKGVLGCGGGRPATSATSPPSPSTTRSFTASARLLDPRDPSKLKIRRAPAIPHPPPHFPMTVFLADGSSINLMTTSPRSQTRLTRDPTVHPVWNPSQEGKAGIGADEAARMERFRKRFAGGFVGYDATEGGEGEDTVKPAEWDPFDSSDVEWMSGGREARAGARVASPSAGKKK